MKVRTIFTTAKSGLAKARTHTVSEARSMIRVIQKPYKTLAHQRQQETMQRYLTFGEQDVTDLLSYEALDENIDYVVIDGRYRRSLYISAYPRTAKSGWLDSLATFTHNMDVSYQFHEIEPTNALHQLIRKITELESQVIAKESSGQIVRSDLLGPLKSAKELYERISNGEEKMFQLSIVISLDAVSLTELDNTTQLLETELAARLFYLKTARYRQLKALQTVLPRADDVLMQRRNFDTSSLALTFPMTSSELIHENGILYGTNTKSNSLVIIDRFALHNANSIMFASSGSGKSYASKTEILRQLMLGTKIIVIDPEGEYRDLAESVNGTLIKISPTRGDTINPFDTGLSSSDPTKLTEHIQNLREVIGVLAGELSSRERAIVDKALIKTYKSMKRTPLLKDFHYVLSTYKDETISERLEEYVSGSMADSFNRQTTIKLDNRLVVFDIKEMPESMRRVTMLIITNYVSSIIKEKPQRRMLVIDEAWMLLATSESARAIAGLVRRARKYYLGVAMITQQANDFLKNDYGQAMASQSSLRFLLRQDTTTIKRVESEFALSEAETHFLKTCGKGEALIITDQNHVTVKIKASAKEHPLITTDPRELYK